MKKIIGMLFFALLVHGTAFAREKTLYDISQDTILLVEAYTACAEPGGQRGSQSIRHD